MWSSKRAEVLRDNQQQQSQPRGEYSNSAALAQEGEVILVQHQVEEGRQQQGAAHGAQATHKAHDMTQHCIRLRSSHAC